MPTIQDLVQSVRNKRVSDEVIPPQSVIDTRLVLRKNPEKITQAPKPEFQQRIGNAFDSALGFLQDPFNKNDQVRALDEQIGREKLRDIAFPFLLKPQSEKVLDRYNRLLEIGVDAERASALSTADVVLNDFSDPQTLFKRIAVMKDLQPTPSESKILRTRGLIEAGGSAIELPIIPFGTVGRLSAVKNTINKLQQTTPSFLGKVKSFFSGKPNPADNLARDAGRFVKGTDGKVPFVVPDETIKDKTITAIQDKFQRLGIVQKSIQQTGKKINEAEDAFLLQELYSGRTAERIDNFREATIFSERKPGTSLLERLDKSNVDLDEFGQYLQARHAIERNRKVAKINPDLPDGGSGMTNAQADEVIRNLARDKRIDDFEKFANEFYTTVTQQRLHILEQSGLLAKEVADTFRGAYKNYVPLKVAEKADQGFGIGRGFSVQGKDVKRVKGSLKERVNPVVQALLDHEATIIKSEKNRVGQAFLKLVRENPNKDLWDVEALKFAPRFDKAGELVTLDPKFKFADNVLEVRENGKTFLITIKDKALAKAMKNLGTERSIRGLQTVNNFLRAINTTINPEFVITNFERDIQTALINVAGEQGKAKAAEVAKNVPNAMKGIWKWVRNSDETNEWSKLYGEMREQGGRVGWFDLKTVEEKSDELQKLIKRFRGDGIGVKFSKVINTVGEYISNVNEVTESAVRLSAYKAAKESGMSTQKAAQLAKNLTVNFNKKGNLGTAVNSLYLFANAGVQGSARIITALRHRGVQKIVAGIVAGNVALNEMNRAINEKEFNKISDFTKNTNMIFMLPNGDHLKIRLPYGYNVFKVMGDSIYDVMHGNKTTAEATTNLFFALEQSFNPLSDGSLLQILSPTLLDPIVQQAENKNFFGAPIKPRQFPGAEKPESQLFFRGVREQTKAFSEWLNRITGGSKTESGAVDISPELLDHYVDFIGGGVGRFISNTVSTGTSIKNNELPEFKNIPFVRQMIGTPFPEFERVKARDTLDKSRTKELTTREREDFFDNLRNGIANETISLDEGKKMFNSFARNEARIVAGRTFDRIKDASASDRQKAVGELSELEREELIKIIEREFGS